MAEKLTKAAISKDVQADITQQDYTKKPTIEGVQIVEVPWFTDDGGFFMELARFEKGIHQQFPEFEVKQVNYSEMVPGVIKASHLHFNQEDIWFIPPSQRLLVGLKDMREGSATEGQTMRFVMGGGKARLVYIPRGVAHGAANLWNTSAAIIYFVNNTFSPDPDESDEYRLPWDIFGEGFWEMSKE